MAVTVTTAWIDISNVRERANSGLAGGALNQEASAKPRCSICRSAAIALLFVMVAITMASPAKIQSCRIKAVILITLNI
ncbi:hypothetical protein NLM27_41115 [Bradyrhizobium sp. CCGB12]|uniref:hypothetical protein n=1 Tax=Bradyrhizobium sp. CCGB12 TaxID=2949632 RepID=UPI0020B1B93A|nr:hypothetical protein [Bradyrhizobium sp. CCGB12]MCP3395146.1 hypothetical protein [Bradyrhizobium sp. CCGB12]